MSRATPNMRALAKRLIAHEVGTNRRLETGGPRVFLAGEKLRPHLAALVGAHGVQALISRALALAAPEVPWLCAVHIKTDGSFEGLVEGGAQVDPEKFAEGNVAVLAQLLGLLVTFIGESLTLRLVSEVWTELLFDGLDFGEGKKNEKPKRRT